MLKTKQKVLLTAALTMIMLWAFGLCVFAAPATPTGLKQTNASSTSVEFAWNKVSGANYYIVERSSDQRNWVYVKNKLQNNESIFSLNAGSTYFVRVRATTDGYVDGSNYDVNNSAAQGDVSAATAPLAVVTSPKEPTNIRQTGATKNSITLEWNASIGATSYLVYSGETLLGNVKTNRITINNIAPATKKYYNVYAIRQSSTVAAASYYSANIYAVSAPDKIGGVGLYWSGMNSSKSSKYNYCVEWNSSYNVDGYQVEWCDQKGKVVKRTESGRTYLSSILKLPTKLRNKAFKVRVRGFVNDSGGSKIYGEWSADKVIVPYAQITSAKLASKSSLNYAIKWKKISGAKSYTIYRATSYNGKYKKVGTTKKNNFVIKKNKARRNYYYYVSANKVKVGKKRYNTTKGSFRHDYNGYYLYYKYTWN